LHDQQQQQELQQTKKMCVVYIGLLMLIVYLSGAQR